MNLYLDTSGYLRFKDNDKLFHHWVAEKKIGRSLRFGEEVHHINRNTLDNHPDNLCICAKQQQNCFHQIDAKGFSWA